MENVETKKCSRCKRREVVENYKQCASCLEYSRNYTKTHPESRKELTKSWKERNPERIKEYNNEQVECPYCKQKYSRKYLWKHKKYTNNFDKNIKKYFYHHHLHLHHLHFSSFYFPPPSSS